MTEKQIPVLEKLLHLANLVPCGVFVSPELNFSLTGLILNYLKSFRLPNSPKVSDCIVLLLNQPDYSLEFI